MFPLSENDMLVIEDPLFFQQDQILEELLLDNSLPNKDSEIEEMGPRKSSSDNIKEGNKGGSNKLMHREIERQRRQGMAKLYASLRSLLPIEYVKGKRSVSDHTEGAVAYIKRMQNNINELSLRKEKLKKKAANLGHINVQAGSLTQGRVTVNPCHHGQEILISSTCKEREFNLSSVLVELINLEVNVVSCVSTKSDGKSFHIIRTEANSLSMADASVLQQKLDYMVNLT